MTSIRSGRSAPDPTAGGTHGFFFSRCSVLQPRGSRRDRQRGSDTARGFARAKQRQNSGFGRRQVKGLYEVSVLGDGALRIADHSNGPHGARGEPSGWTKDRQEFQPVGACVRLARTLTSTATADSQRNDALEHELQPGIFRAAQRMQSGAVNGDAALRRTYSPSTTFRFVSSFIISS